MLARLLQKRAGQAWSAWPLATHRPVVIGRSSTTGPRQPDIALDHDRFVSRRHAQVSFADGRWWIQDLGSRYGTVVRGATIGPDSVPLSNGDEVLIGNTLLVLAAANRPELRCGRYRVEVDAAPAVNFSLVHCGFPIVEQIVVHAAAETAQPARLSLHVGAYAAARDLEIPPLSNDAVASFSRPTFTLDYAALQTQTERARCPIQLEIDGAPAEGEGLECWVLAHNEWSAAEAHRVSLAAFVLPNHPLVSQLVSELDSPVGDDPSHFLDALHEQFATRWRLTYQLEPPHWDSASQKVRLPHQVLVDPVGRIGAGTCLDLALLYAACLEHVGLQPVVAVIDMGEWWHALVGAWRTPGAYLGLEPIVVDRQRLLDEADWIDATASTSTPAMRRDVAGARTEAIHILTQQPLQFALDVRAARQDHITPLPFAGEPYPSPAVQRALDSARRDVSGAGLLLSLLRVEGGLTRQIVATQVGSLDAAAQRMHAALAGRPGRAADQTSGSVRRARDLARSLARGEGSPMILEPHLLAALLQTPSASLDTALTALGTTRADLLAGVRIGQKPGAAQYSVFSEWRSVASPPSPPALP